MDHSIVSKGPYESPFYHMLKTWNLILGTLLFSVSQYVFFYCFELRRYFVLTTEMNSKDLNYVRIYGQVLVMVIVPLFFLTIWKIRKCKKPLIIELGATLIPLLVVLSSVISSWEFYNEENYLFVYLMELVAALLYTISLGIIKYTQKSFYHTFQTMIYSDLLISIVWIILRYFYIFPWIYSERETYHKVYFYEPLLNPMIIVVALSYIASIYLIAHMMWQSQHVKSDFKWSKSKIRITTLLWLKAFESEILTLISLFINSEQLGILDMISMFILIIAVLIMSWDDTSKLLIQTIWMKPPISPELDNFG